MENKNRMEILKIVLENSANRVEAAHKDCRRVLHYVSERIDEARSLVEALGETGLRDPVGRAGDMLEKLASAYGHTRSQAFEDAVSKIPDSDLTKATQAHYALSEAAREQSRQLWDTLGFLPE